MSKKRKILLIENQYIQFQTISKLLDTADYEVCPNKNEICEFIYFINLVRVLLNERYSTDRRNKALEKLLAIIDCYKPELLIIDHILVGNHSAKNGIDLAIKFRSKQILQPIIFLSRTERNNLSVCQDLSKLKEENFWINKGYSGKQILEKKSFEREVVPKIKTLLGIDLKTKRIEELKSKNIQITANSSNLDRDIASITKTLIAKINNNNIDPSEEMFEEISKVSGTEYLTLLRKLNEENNV